jgi:hypothetical protein
MLNVPAEIRAIMHKLDILVSMNESDHVNKNDWHAMDIKVNWLY